MVLKGNRVAAYARYSDDQQNESSTEDQFRKADDFLRRLGRPSLPASLKFGDSAKSAASTQGRDDWARLMEMVKRQEVDVLLVESTSRLSRNESDSFRAWEELKALVHAHALRFVSSRFWPINWNTLDCFTDHFEVVSVGTVDCEANWNSISLRKQTSLGSAFCAVGRIGAGFFPHPAAPLTSRHPSITKTSRSRLKIRTQIIRDARILKTHPPRSTR